jgi:hypothetical protein
MHYADKFVLLQRVNPWNMRHTGYIIKYLHRENLVVNTHQTTKQRQKTVQEKEVTSLM